MRSRCCEVPIAVVERALTGDRPELLLMLLKAMKFNWATLSRTSGCVRSRNRARSSIVEQCLASYERIKLATASKRCRYHRRRSLGPTKVGLRTTRRQSARQDAATQRCMRKIR